MDCKEELLIPLPIEGLRFHKDNLRHLPRFPDFFVTFRILSTTDLMHKIVYSFKI